MSLQNICGPWIFDEKKKTRVNFKRLHRIEMDTNEALALLRSGRVVAMIDGNEWNVTEIKDDPATLWFRLRSRQGDDDKDRRFIVVGSASDAEIRHVKRAKKRWVKSWGVNFALYSVQAKEVLALRGALRRGGEKVFLKLEKEVYTKK